MGNQPPVVEAVAEPVEVLEVEAEPAFDIPVYNPNFPPLTAENHNGLRTQIRALATLAECSTFYDDSISLKRCLEELFRAQREALGDLTGDAARVQRFRWCIFWALALSNGEEWAKDLNHCRKTLLTLIYHVVDLESKTFKNTVRAWVMPFLGYDNYIDLGNVERIVQIRRLSDILTICLPMDCANCLFNMTIIETNERGLGWYANGEEDAYQNLMNGDPVLPLNPEGGTINKRLKTLHHCLFQDDITMGQLLTPQAPQRLMT